MVAVEEFNDMKAAAVDIKVDIALFKIRRDGLPNLYLRIHLLDLAPCGIADTLAVDMRRYKEQIEITFIAVDAYNCPADDFSITENTVCFTFFDGFLSSRGR